MHKQLAPKAYLRVLRDSKFCLAPSGMGFSTRSYESIAQGCVPLVIQDEPVSRTSVDQAFEDVLPWDEFSLRLEQKDIPRLPQLLAEYPDDKWRALKRNLACVWPRVVWLHPGEALSLDWSRSCLEGYSYSLSLTPLSTARAAAGRKLCLHVNCSATRSTCVHPPPSHVSPTRSRHVSPARPRHVSPAPPRRAPSRRALHTRSSRPTLDAGPPCRAPHS